MIIILIANKNYRKIFQITRFLIFFYQKLEVLLKKTLIYFSHKVTNPLFFFYFPSLVYFSKKKKYTLRILKAKKKIPPSFLKILYDQPPITPFQASPNTSSMNHRHIRGVCFNYTIFYRCHTYSIFRANQTYFSRCVWSMAAASGKEFVTSVTGLLINWNDAKPFVYGSLVAL